MLVVELGKNLPHIVTHTMLHNACVCAVCMTYVSVSPGVNRAPAALWVHLRTLISATGSDCRYTLPDSK